MCDMGLQSLHGCDHIFYDGEPDIGYIDSDSDISHRHIDDEHDNSVSDDCRQHKDGNRDKYQHVPYNSGSHGDNICTRGLCSSICWNRC